MTFSIVWQAPVERLVGRGLELDDAAAAIAAVGGDDEARAGILDAIAQRIARSRRTPPNGSAPMRAQACIAMTASGTIGM